MKFYTELPNTDSYQPIKYYQSLDSFTLQQNLLINFIQPQIKLFCDQCQSILIPSQISILTQQNQHQKIDNYKDLCIKCFCHILKNPAQNKIQKYHIRLPNTYSLTEQNWRVSDDILLLKSIQKYGYGNWDKISIWMQSHNCFINKKEYQEHFLQYLAHEESQWTKQSYFRQWIQQKQRLAKPFYLKTQQYKKSLNEIKQNKDEVCQQTSAQQPQSSNDLTINTQSGQREEQRQCFSHLALYTPQRDEFLLDSDPYAECLISNLEFNQNDTQEEIMLKQKLLIQYNTKLLQRKKRKRLALQQGQIISSGKEKSSIKKQTINLEQQKELFKMCEDFGLKSVLQSSKKFFVDDKQIQSLQSEMTKYLTLKTLAQTFTSMKRQSDKIDSKSYRQFDMFQDFVKNKIQEQKQNNKNGQMNQNKIRDKRQNIKRVQQGVKLPQSIKNNLQKITQMVKNQNVLLKVNYLKIP